METVAVCSICHQAHLWDARFCPNCGAPVEVNKEAEEGGTRLQAEPAFDLTKQVSLIEVAQILHTIATLPNRRTRPQEGDLEGDYDEWFDGGAVRHVTGYNVYEFRNGVRATWDVLPHLSVSIELANGARIGVKQAQLASKKSIVCPQCEGEKSLFYFADGSVTHWGRPPRTSEDCPSVVGTCWACDGEGFITPERKQELELYLQWGGSVAEGAKLGGGVVGTVRGHGPNIAST